ncbi:hypothetical protein [Nitratireductor sp. GCM10026969]|uniref:hypothetical protein n=1 Tax=Nitratireductor sp. GCM10026969 TaxID=3252645 RepID=UPI00361BA5A3
MYIRTAVALGLTALLAGCMTLPTTVEGYREFAASSSLVGKQEYDVSRPASAVAATWRSRSAECLNFGSQTSLTRLGGSPGSGMNAVFRDSYRTRVETVGGHSSLVIEHYSPNNIGAEGWYVYLVADVEPAGGGSHVTVFAPLATGAFTRPIRAWAEGNTKPCPLLDM